MARVLLIDDEAAPRRTAAEVVRALGHEVVEAGSGAEGVEKASLGGFSLAVVDHAMPGLDGAAVVEAMRVLGDRTPVIVLLSDLKRATVAALMKLGITEMVTKPLHAAELAEKIAKIVGRADPGLAPAPVAPQPEPAAPVPSAPKRQSAPGSAARARTSSPGVVAAVPTSPVLPDEPSEAKVLIVDHMDAVCRALAALIPPDLGVHACRSINEAQLRMCSGSYKLIFFEVDLPVNGLPALIDQYRALQRDAVFVGVAVAKENGEPPDRQNDGFVFDEVITRPFDPVLVADLSDQFSGAFQHLVELSGENLLRVAAFRGRRPRLDAYLENLERQLRGRLHGLAEACVDQVIIDLTHLPPAHAARTARFVGDLLLKQAVVGLQLRLVAAPPFQEALRALPETRNVHCYQTVDQAQLAA